MVPTPDVSNLDLTINHELDTHFFEEVEALFHFSQLSVLH